MAGKAVVRFFSTVFVQSRRSASPRIPHLKSLNSIMNHVKLIWPVLCKESFDDRHCTISLCITTPKGPSNDKVPNKYLRATRYLRLGTLDPSARVNCWATMLVSKRSTRGPHNQKCYGKGWGFISADALSAVTLFLAGYSYKKVYQS